MKSWTKNYFGSGLSDSYAVYHIGSQADLAQTHSEMQELATASTSAPHAKAKTLAPKTYTKSTPNAWFRLKALITGMVLLVVCSAELQMAHKILVS